MCVFLPNVIFNSRCGGKRTSKGPNGSLQAVLEGMKKRSSYDGGEGSGMCVVRTDRKLKVFFALVLSRWFIGPESISERPKTDDL